MTLHSDLVTQARHLATFDRTRPKQANLRRAVSSAYYGLFHLLAAEGARQVTTSGGLRHVVRRKYDHRTMKDVSLALVQGRGWVHRTGIVISPKLREVAQTFVVLQEERHNADYNLETTFTRTTALESVERAEVALRTWNDVRKSAAASLYLLTMLLGAPRE